MGVPYRKSTSTLACSPTDPTTITLDRASGIVSEDTKLQITLVPIGSGTGNVAVSFAGGAADTTFTTAYDDFGRAIIASMASPAIIQVSDVDLYKLKLTPSAFSGVTGYDVHITVLG